MKKSILLLLALVFVLSCSAFVAMAEDIAPVLKLSVAVNNASNTNVTYTAQLVPVPTISTQVPVISFYCNGRLLAKVAIDNTGTAVYRFFQGAGKYQAVAAWENTPIPIKSIIVDYIVPIIP